MPTWLTVNAESDIDKLGTNEDSEITFTISLNGAPVGETLTIPCVIRSDNGKEQRFEITAVIAEPQNFPTELLPNSPNPFNPSTTIPFSLNETGHISLIVYNALGQKITTLADDVFNAGFHQKVWNGYDDQGNRVSSGVYICRLKTGTSVTSIKMLLFE